MLAKRGCTMTCQGTLEIYGFSPFLWSKRKGLKVSIGKGIYDIDLYVAGTNVWKDNNGRSNSQIYLSVFSCKISHQLYYHSVLYLVGAKAIKRIKCQRLKAITVIVLMHCERAQREILHPRSWGGGRWCAKTWRSTVQHLQAGPCGLSCRRKVSLPWRSGENDQLTQTAVRGGGLKVNLHGHSWYYYCWCSC